MIFKNKERIINNGETPQIKKARKDIIEILDSSIKAVNPYNAIKSKIQKNFDFSNYNNIYLIGFGKASVGMAQAVVDTINISYGAVVTNDSKSKVNSNNIETYIGAHPIPNNDSINAADRILNVISKCNENDLLVVLISGGGSALLTKPHVPLKDLQITTDLLLKSGANINEINTIRKHLSLIKGGRLISTVKCKVISFIISDIINDPIEFIASGPTYPDSTTFNDAKKILEKYHLWHKIPNSVRAIIINGIQGKIPETPKKDNPIFKNISNYIVANNKLACEAAEKKAKEIGYKTLLLTSSLDGEAKEIGQYLVLKAINYQSKSKKFLFISGGETTVNIKGNGKGGRNQEMILSSIKSISQNDIVFASFATDGIDGNSVAAGAIIDRFSLKRAKKQNLDFEKYLDNNNSYVFFKHLDDLLLTGPTGTNVMDIQLIIKIE